MLPTYHWLLTDRWMAERIKAGGIPSYERRRYFSRLLWWYLRHDFDLVERWFPPFKQEATPSRKHARKGVK